LKGGGAEGDQFGESQQRKKSMICRANSQCLESVRKKPLTQGDVKGVLTKPTQKTIRIEPQPLKKKRVGGPKVIKE